MKVGRVKLVLWNRRIAFIAQPDSENDVLLTFDTMYNSGVPMVCVGWPIKYTATLRDRGYIADEIKLVDSSNSLLAKSLFDRSRELRRHISSSKAEAADIIHDAVLMEQAAALLMQPGSASHGNA